MLSVLDNAYFKKAKTHPNFSDTHQKLLFWLLFDKKYYSKYELLCLTNHDEKKLDKAIKELTETGTIKTEGWLVKIADSDTLNKQICEELCVAETRGARKPL
ncbi:MAG: hypothetical protein WCW13_06895 [archaeon]|jgi:hypothetical protein